MRTQTIGYGIRCVSWILQDSIKAKSKMSKAEKMREKKDKAKSFNGGGTKGKEGKNAKRWN